MQKMNTFWFCQADMHLVHFSLAQTHCGMDAKLIGAHKPMQHNGAPSCHKKKLHRLQKR